MEKKILYLDPYSVLVVNKRGKLVRVFCPFLARSLIEPESRIEVVEMVLAENELQLSFLINGKKNPSKNWDLVL